MRRGLGTHADGPYGVFLPSIFGCGLGSTDTLVNFSLEPGSTCSHELSRPLGVKPKYCLLPTLHSGPRILSNSTPTQNVSRSDSQDSPYVMCKLWGTRRGHVQAWFGLNVSMAGRHTSRWFLPQSSTRVTGCTHSSACRGPSTHLELQCLNDPVDESEEGALGPIDHPSLKSTSLSLCNSSH